MSAAAWLTTLIAVASLAETPPTIAPAEEGFSSATYQAARPAPPSARTAQQIADVRDGGRVNVNVADAQTLQLLPGVGPVVSARIIADREANGPYPTLDAMTRVRGIGPRSVERMAALAFAGPAAAAASSGTPSPAGEQPGNAHTGPQMEPSQHVD